MDKKVIHYEDKRGIKPVKQFMSTFDGKTRGKILARLEFLEMH